MNTAARSCVVAPRGPAADPVERLPPVESARPRRRPAAGFLRAVEDWSRFPNYFFGDPSAHHVTQSFARIRAPDDGRQLDRRSMGAAESRDAFMPGYRNAARHTLDLDPLRRRTPVDRAHGLLQTERETAVGVGARLARDAPHGFLAAGRSHLEICRMNTHTALHAVPDVGAPRAGALPERPGCLVAGAGAPVVLLHSSLSSKSQWAALAERLAPRFRVIALDLCGYGDNAMRAAPESFTLDDEVRLVAGHVDRLVPPHVRVHVVGHSYGGLVALRFAQRSRGRVASLSLYEPVAFGMLDQDDATLVEVKRIAECMPRLIAAGSAPGTRQSCSWISGAAAGSYGRLSLRLSSASRATSTRSRSTFRQRSPGRRAPRAFARSRCLSLLLSGNHSPAVAQRIAQRLTHALPKRYVGRIDAGHMGPVTTPHLVNPWIEAFIDMCVEHDAAQERRAVVRQSASAATEEHYVIRIAAHGSCRKSSRRQAEIAATATVSAAVALMKERNAEPLARDQGASPAPSRARRTGGVIGTARCGTTRLAAASRVAACRHRRLGQTFSLEERGAITSPCRPRPGARRAVEERLERVDDPQSAGAARLAIRAVKFMGFSNRRG